MLYVASVNQDNDAIVFSENSSVYEEYKDKSIKIDALPDGTGCLKCDGAKVWREAVVVDIAKLRAAALERISGKCSAAIYSGVTVDGKHYKLTATAQSNLATAQAKVNGGATSVIYSADGAAPALFTAAQITAISAAAYEWGVVNTSYYAALQSYIAAETDADKLKAIDYGKALPDSNMQQLTALLTSAGIDITKYTAALTAAN